MKCKLYFKNPYQVFTLKGTREEIVANYINNNEFPILEIRSYGKVTKLKALNAWNKVDTVKVRCL